MNSECVLVVGRMLLNCIQLRFVQKTAMRNDMKGSLWFVNVGSPIDPIEKGGSLHIIAR